MHEKITTKNEDYNCRLKRSSDFGGSFNKNLEEGKPSFLTDVLKGVGESTRLKAFSQISRN